jgi:hypothetical protein
MMRGSASTAEIGDPTNTVELNGAAEVPPSEAHARQQATQVAGRPTGYALAGIAPGLTIAGPVGYRSAVASALSPTTSITRGASACGRSVRRRSIS